MNDDAVFCSSCGESASSVNTDNVEATKTSDFFIEPKLDNDISVVTPESNAYRNTIANENDVSANDTRIDENPENVTEAIEESAATEKGKKRVSLKKESALQNLPLPNMEKVPSPALL